MVRKLLVAALLLVPLAARGDTKPGPKAVPKTAEQMHVDDCAKARQHNRNCVLDMGGETIKGDGVGGDGIVSSGITFDNQASLIRLRRDFIPEIIKSAEAL